MFPEILSAVKGKKVLVIGDVIQDRYIFGRVDRLSPEAPVPVFVPEKEEFRPGGAGNVEANIISLGGKCLMLSPNYHHKSVKTRYIAKPYNQQLLRVDEDKPAYCSPNFIMKFAQDLIDESDAVIIADYNKGVITPELLLELLPYLKDKGKPVMVDPAVKHFGLYQGVTCLTPNLAEASAGMGVDKPSNRDEVVRLGFKILDKLKVESLLITQGADGMTLFMDDFSTVIPAMARAVFDVSGAGDTVIAALTLARCAGFTFNDSAKFASACAGIVVGKVGTSTVKPEEILAL